MKKHTIPSETTPASSNSFSWGQGRPPSQKVINDCQEHKEKYEAYVAQYRLAHDGASPPPARSFFSLMNVIHSGEDIEERTANTPQQGPSQ